MSGDEYIALLLERQAEAVTGNPLAPAPLLESMVRPGDEALFTPPVEQPQPKRVTAPRRYRSAADLRAERDRLIGRRDAVAEPVMPEVAAAHGVALGARRTARAQATQDRRLAQWADLNRRVEALDQRIAAATRREAAA